MFMEIKQIKKSKNYRLITDRIIGWVHYLSILSMGYATTIVVMIEVKIGKDCCSK